MTNSLTPSNPTWWSYNCGKKLYKTAIFRAITDFSEEPLVKGSGDEIEKPYPSDVTLEDYTAGEALTAQDVNMTSDIMYLNKCKAALIYIDNVSKLQSRYDVTKIWAEELGKRGAVRIDADVIYEAFNCAAANVVDAADLGGNAAEGIPINPTNVPKVLGIVNELLDDNDVVDGEKMITVTPKFYNALWQFVGGKSSALGEYSQCSRLIRR